MYKYDKACGTPLYWVWCQDAGEKLEMVLQRTALVVTSHGHMHCKDRWNALEEQELVQSLVKKMVGSNTMGAHMYSKRRCKDAWPKLLSVSRWYNKRW